MMLHSILTRTTAMTDVAIIGAGPAGSLAAALLVQQGFEVTVLERQTFPRFSVGESLLAQSLDLIDRAGLLPAVQRAGFQYKNGAAFRYREQRSNYNFADKSSAGPGYTYQVPRGEFDKLLIDEAERMGAKVRYQVEIIAADMSGERPTLSARHVDGSVEVLKPRFVLDASGFGRVLPKLLKLEVPSAFPMRAALFTQVFDGIASGAFDRQKIHVTVHPVNRGIWFWLIPFSNGKASVGVVADDAVLQSYPGSNEQRLWALINEDPGLRELLKQAKPALPVGELRGYAANVTRMSGTRLRAAWQRRGIPRSGVLVRCDHRDEVRASGVCGARPAAQGRNRRLDCGLRATAQARRRHLPQLRRKLVPGRLAGHLLP